MPYYNKKTQQWIAQVRYQYKTYRKTCKTKTEAKRWEISKIKELTALPTIQQETTPTISLLDFANRYLNYSKIKHSQKTYKEKCLAFKVLFLTIDSSMNVESLNKGAVLNHLQHQASVRSGYAANKDRKNLIAAWNWAIEYIEFFPSKNPFNTKRFPEIRQPRYIPPLDDFWKVYKVAESSQDQLMLLCYLHLAARRSEIFGLRWEDINMKDKTITLYTRKRKDGSLEYDTLPLTDTLYRSLLKHYQERDNNTWVFPNPLNDFPYVTRLKWMRRLCNKAGVKPFGLHSIRHLTASLLTSNNVILPEIQKILRHKNLTTTQRYIHNLNHIKDSLNNLPIPD